MKNIFWSLAALMLMAVTTFISCTSDLDEVTPAEEVKNNIVTITIAPPAAERDTRVAMSGLNVTGWELDDEVTMYKVSNNEYPTFGVVSLYGTGVTFKCIDPTSGTFSGDMGGEDINDYTFAVFGAEAVEIGIYIDKIIALVPKTMGSENLKDVVIMAAYKDDGAYTMQVVNNVMKIQNGTAEDIEVAVYGKSYGDNATPDFRIPLSGWGQGRSGFGFRAPLVNDISNAYCGWENAKHFTLKQGVDSYVNMGMFDHPADQWGIAKEDGTEVVARNIVSPKEGVKGKLFNAGTYTGTPIQGTIPSKNEKE